MSVTVRSVHAREILDSRGNPTLEARAELSDGSAGAFQVPSGVSTGRHEAVELRDGDPRRYAGKGVRRAVDNVNAVIAPAVAGCDAREQAALDRRLIELDGTPSRERLGANAILAVSGAVARAAARSLGVPEYRYLCGPRPVLVPLPMVNILSGGRHAGRNFEFQDFLIVPHSLPTYSEALEASVAVHRAAHDEIEARGYLVTGLADEGGWGPRLETNELAIQLLVSAIERAGFRPGDEIAIAIDAAATHFDSEGEYRLDTGKRRLSSEGMIELLESWCRRYPIVAIEDGLAEDDWDGWKLLTARLGRRVQLVGDDLFTTNPVRLARGIREGAANAVLVKMNQIGTLTETFEVIDAARRAGYRAVISARSGETEDPFLADLAVASGAGQIKIGSVARSERLAKYNRLLEIEAEGVPYAGRSVLDQRAAEIENHN